jgi:hypothetical protein
MLIYLRSLPSIPKDMLEYIPIMEERAKIEMKEL